MRHSLGLFVYFAGTAWAAGAALTPEAEAALLQLSAALPTCAVLCLAQTVPVSGCDLTDINCICTNQELALATATCLGGNCTVVESLQTKRFQDEMCGMPVRSRQPTIFRVSWGLWAASVLAVAARFAARSSYFDGAGFGSDDWVILGVEGIVTAIAACGYLMIDAGLGKDMWMLQPENINAVLRWFWIEEMLYSIAVVGTKISIVLLYLRIFPDTVSSGFRTICFIIMGCLVATATAFSLSIGFQCSPVSYNWTRWDTQYEGRCINTMAQIYAGSAANITLDLIVFALPIPRLLTVQISVRRKVGICMTFLVGLFVTLCSLIRLLYVVRWRATTNPTWTYSPIGLWSIIEVDIGVICACMPALAGPIKKIWTATVGKQLSSLYGSGKDRSKSASGNHSKISSGGWRTISRSADVKPGADAIMCNVSLNISDEVELVDKNPGPGAPGTGVDLHGYRQRW